MVNGSGTSEWCNLGAEIMTKNYYFAGLLVITILYIAPPKPYSNHEGLYSLYVLKASRKFRSVHLKFLDPAVVRTLSKVSGLRLRV